MSGASKGLVRVSRGLSSRVAALRFGEPVTHVYDPTRYARAPHERYLKRYGRGKREGLLVGMNPGPFGMAQTGVPFGEVGLVREWLGIEGKVGAPEREHPKRPIHGFSCPRSEVSGRRLWGWAKERYETPERFFARWFVWNYCPLVFMEESGRNRTPDKLPAAERDPLFEACDRALAEVVDELGVSVVLGVGRFAESRARACLDTVRGLVVDCVPHPSPASPAANRGWAKAMDERLEELALS